MALVDFICKTKAVRRILEAQSKDINVDLRTNRDDLHSSSMK